MKLGPDLFQPGRRLASIVTKRGVILKYVLKFLAVASALFIGAFVVSEGLSFVLLSVPFTRSMISETRDGITTVVGLIAGVVLSYVVGNLMEGKPLSEIRVAMTRGLVRIALGPLVVAAIAALV
jgi:hypothetical protein